MATVRDIVRAKEQLGKQPISTNLGVSQVEKELHRITGKKHRPKRRKRKTPSNPDNLDREEGQPTAVATLAMKKSELKSKLEAVIQTKGEW